jgi:DNA-directed RNA polymerase subunit RPC12/RpoP
MAKKEKPDTCPRCGAENWLGTSEGAKCKECGYVKGQAPVVK